MSSFIDIYNYPSDPSLVPEYRVAVMQAALAGMPVQFRTTLAFAPCWKSVATPCWNWEVSDYRIDPDSKPAPAPTTVEGWLRLLPDGYRERALGYTPNEMRSKPVRKLSDALGVAFPWVSTVEGHDFWAEVFMACLRGSATFPLIPETPKTIKEWRPWTLDTAPRLNVLLRPTVNRAVHRIPTGWEREGINLLKGWISYPGLLDKWEHSLDGGKTWSRCGTQVSVEVDA